MSANRIAAVVMLAALTVPALAGCSPSKAERVEQSKARAAAQTSAAATSAAVATRQRLAAEVADCEAEFATDANKRRMCADAVSVTYCGSGVGDPAKVYEETLIYLCANEFVRAAQSGTPIPTVALTSPVTVTTTSAAPTTTSPGPTFTVQQSAPSDSGSSPAPWLIGGGLLVVLAGGAVVGGRALLRRLPTPAHGRYSAPMQQQYTAPEPQLPEQPADHNPWA